MNEQQSTGMKRTRLCVKRVRKCREDNRLCVGVYSKSDAVDELVTRESDTTKPFRHTYMDHREEERVGLISRVRIRQ